MPLALQVEGLSYRYPDQPDLLFEGLSFHLYAGDKVALLGANGTGKTTLLKLLTGDLSPLDGQIVRHAAPYHLRQEDLSGGQGGEARVLDALMMSFPDLGPLQARLRRMEREGVPDPLAYAEGLSAFAERGGYEVRARLEADLELLGLPPELLERPLAALSGGERRMVRLVAAFARPQGLHLLDEPTNYLDARGVRYLTDRVRRTGAACLVVSHDRRFLDETVGVVLELARGKLTRYGGNYSTFWATKEAHYRQAQRTSERLKGEIARLKEQERAYKVWGARKEGEKSGAFDKGFIGARAARLMKRGLQAKERLRARAETLTAAKPWVEKRYEVLFDPPVVPRGVLLSARGVRVLGREVAVHLEWGERLAILGDNGAGKTTLLRALLEPSPGQGEVHWDARAVVGYLPQRWEGAHDAVPVAERFPREDHDRARTLLGALGVRGDLFTAPLGSLSEGQKRKVRLVELILTRPNVLVLDEPTTHLDYVSVEMLEAALTDFSGSILLVTHDRYLRERVSGRVLELPPAVRTRLQV